VTTATSQANRLTPSQLTNRLPFLLGAGSNDADSASLAIGDEQPGLERHGLRILIVEDEALVALDMAMILEGVGYEIIGITPTGDSALTALKAAADQGALPDLVLMDIALRGGLDGIETTQLMKSAYSEIGVVFVTGQADRATRERAETTKPAGYLLKPFTPEQLVRFVKSVSDL
jgi:CheY-like chemotaxis protein